MDGRRPRRRSAHLAGYGSALAIDEKAVRAADDSQADWHNPVWRHEDGSFAEW